MTHISSCIWIIAIMLIGYFTIVNAQLFIVEAGLFGSNVRNKEFVIPSGKVFNFCPASFSNKGFTIECRGHRIVPPISFFVNGKLYREETTVPYTLGGDIDMKRFPWSPTYPLPSTVTVSCFSVKAIPYIFQTAVINFTCPAMIPTPYPTPTPSKYEIKTGCVVIKAEDHLNKLTNWWTQERSGGLTFRKGNSSKAISEPGSSSLIYTFSVPVKARYAFTIDMTTRGETHHNDVSVQFLFDGGFLLTHDETSKKGGDGFLKAYHNRTRRATEAYTGDHDSHLLHTKAELHPGVEYYFSIGGRSTQVTVHRIVMFPCASLECSDFDLYMGNCRSSKCSATDNYWKRMVQRCV